VANAVNRQELLPKLLAAFDFAQQQVRALLERCPGLVPTCTVGGKWNRSPEPADAWCEGFLPSMMWMFFRQTGDAFWAKHAEAATRRLEERKFDGESHDLGFLFTNTWQRWWRQSGDQKHLGVVVQAGRTLAKRWQPKGEYLASEYNRNALLIDLMMNVDLVFFAAKATGDADLHDIARRHCRTTHRYLVREDGSTAQEGLFDPASGRFLRESNRQGVKPGSTFARGLAWAIYGFGTAYHLSHDDEFLVTAEECAGFYLDRAEAGMMVPWDFNCPPGPKKIVDSSAAAIAANGFLNLAGLTKWPENRARYVQAALTILDTLCSPTFLARGKPGQEGVLLHGVYDMPRGVGVDESLVWGDHYFVEAIYKIISEKKRKPKSSPGVRKPAAALPAEDVEE
jgi:unsaturated chondroitin disaccharide hydrolase